MVNLLKTKCLQAFIKLVEPIRLTNIDVAKSYSVFAPSFKMPVISKSEQKILKETGEIEVLAHSFIRPALSYETSSEFYDPIVNKFINYLMRCGNKRLARSLVESAFEKIKRIQLMRYHRSPPEKRHEIVLDPVDILKSAIMNVTPVMELIPIKKGGSTYQVPVPILEGRQRFLAMNWLLRAAKEKTPNARYHDVLARELIHASNNQGRVVKKKQDLHKQCEANRAYAHYRWN